MPLYFNIYSFPNIMICYFILYVMYQAFSCHNFLPENKTARHKFRTSFLKKFSL